MICPLMKIECSKVKCAWWDAGNNCCCIKAIVIELIKTGEQQ
jgi:hypothetical protein